MLYDSLRPPEPDDRWTTEAQLLATVVDAVQWANFLLARLGGNTRAKEPAPIPRPGVGPDPGDVSLKGTPRTIEEMNRILNW